MKEDISCLAVFIFMAAFILYTNKTSHKQSIVVITANYGLFAFFDAVVTFLKGTLLAQHCIKNKTINYGGSAFGLVSTLNPQKRAVIKTKNSHYCGKDLIS